MAKNDPISPEEWEDWAEARRRLEESLRRFTARTEELKEREERRRRRLNRLSLGLLGR